MDFPDYKKILSGLKVGKKLPSATYLHVEALHDIPQSLATLLETLKGKLNLGEEYNIIKLGTQPTQLLYRYFGDMACQRINAAITRAHIG